LESIITNAFYVLPQIERRHRLIEELRAAAHRSVRGTELALSLGVSTRTIERDIADLTDAGVPVEVRHGPGGGYRLSLAAHPEPIAFSGGEVAALIATVVAIGPYSSATARSALDKLLAAAEVPTSA
jgi:predicted DNA-binding transcriptional regulator YafY